MLRGAVLVTCAAPALAALTCRRRSPSTMEKVARATLRLLLLIGACAATSARSRCAAPWPLVLHFKISPLQLAARTGLGTSSCVSEVRCHGTSESLLTRCAWRWRRTAPAAAHRALFGANVHGTHASETPCTSGDCKNGGTCTVAPTSAGGHRRVQNLFTCRCKPGYAGESCERRQPHIVMVVCPVLLLLCITWCNCHSRILKSAG